jgi:dihydrofolate reductase
MSEHPLTLVVAIDRNCGIGRANALPWHLPADLAHFKRTTTGHAIIMGRKTFDSIGRPLPNRRNIVITRNPQWRRDGVEAAASLDGALALLAPREEAFVIGGAQIFIEALPRSTRLVVTEIDHVFECDTFMPPIDWAQWQETAREPQHDAAGGFDYAFVSYLRRQPPN